MTGGLRQRICVCKQIRQKVQESGNTTGANQKYKGIVDGNAFTENLLVSHAGFWSQDSKNIKGSGPGSVVGEASDVHRITSRIPPDRRVPAVKVREGIKYK